MRGYQTFLTTTLSALAATALLPSGAHAAQAGRIEQVQLLADSKAPAGLQIVVTTRAGDQPIAGVSIEASGLSAPVCSEAGKSIAGSQRFVCPVVGRSAAAPFGISASVSVIESKGGKNAKVSSKIIDKLSTRLASPMFDDGSGVPGLPADDDPLTSLYVRDVKELADILKNEYGIEPAAAAGLVVSSQGWTLGEALPMVAEWTLQDGTVVQIPLTQLQVTGSIPVSFDADPTGQPFSVLVDGKTRVDLVAGSRRGVCRYGQCFSLVPTNSGWLLQASVSVASAEEVPASQQLTLLSYSSATPKLASDEVRYGSGVHLVFSAAAALTELPAGVVLDGSLALHSAPDSKGKRTTYSSGRVRGVFGSAAAPGLALGSGDGKSAGKEPASALFSAVVGLNTTKERPAVPLTTVLESQELSGVSLDNPLFAPVLGAQTNVLAQAAGGGSPQTTAVILRRHSTFQLSIQSPASNPALAPTWTGLLLVASTGSAGELELDVPTKLVSAPVLTKTATGELMWEAVVEGALPADLPAGGWTLRGYGRDKYDSPFVLGETNALVQFNPADPKAAEFVADEVLRYGLLDEELALLPSPSASSGVQPWAYNQFEPETLRIATEAVGALPLDARRSPAAVAKALGAAVQANLLRGRWDGNYADGKEPGTWSSSSQILKTWGNRKAKYGQCMVFAATTTSLMRGIGIPSRPMTNMGSAHEKAATSQPGPNLCGAAAEGALGKALGGSAVSYHMWVEAKTGSGWQAVDATPQEESDGPSKEPFALSDLWGVQVWNDLTWQPVLEPVVAAPWSYAASKPGWEAAEALAATWTTSLQPAIEALLTRCGDGGGYSRLCRSNLARMYSKPGT